MIPNPLENPDLDDLLKRALAGDLPPDVAAGMEKRFERIRAGAGIKRESAAARAWLPRRIVWAFLSILMLVSGSLLQGLGTRNALADGISLFGTRRAVSEGLSAADSMSCSIRLWDERGQVRDYEIQWRAGGPAEVRRKTADGSVIESFNLGEPGKIEEAPGRILTSVSSPAALRSLIDREWRFGPPAEETGGDARTFILPDPRGPEVLEITIDPRIYFPTRLARPAAEPEERGRSGGLLWEARFSFPTTRRENHDR